MHKDNEWIIGAIVVVLLIGAGIAFAVFNFIWWRECVDAGGVYINGNGVWPSCFKG